MWAFGVKSPNKSDFCSTQFLQQLRVHDLIHQFRHLQDANSQSRRWPRQFLAQFFTEMPKIRLLQEIRKRGRIWSFPRDIQKFWWWLLWVATQQRLQISRSGVSPTSFPFLFFQGWHSQHCSSCLCHPVDSVSLNDLKWGFFLKQFGEISSSNQWGAQLKVRSLAEIVN